MKTKCWAKWLEILAVKTALELSFTEEKEQLRREIDAYQLDFLPSKHKPRILRE